MSTLGDGLNFLRRMPALAMAGFALIIVLYYIDMGDGFVTQESSMVYLAGFALFLIFSVRAGEGDPIPVQDAEEIAMKHYRMYSNQGKIKQRGRAFLLPDATLKRINGKPDAWYVAVGIDDVLPVIFVFSIQPFRGYIMKRIVKETWNAGMDPDLKIVVPPSWLDFQRVRQDFSTDAEVE